MCVRGQEIKEADIYTQRKRGVVHPHATHAKRDERRIIRTHQEVLLQGPVARVDEVEDDPQRLPAGQVRLSFVGLGFDLGGLSVGFVLWCMYGGGGDTYTYR